MKESQFILHIAGFLSFIKLLLRLSNLSIILIFNNLLRNQFLVYDYSLFFFDVWASWLVVEIDTNSLDWDTSCFHGFWDYFAGFLGGYLCLLLVADGTLVSAHFGVAVTWFSAIVSLSQLSVVKRLLLSKLNHLPFRIFDVFVLSKSLRTLHLSEALEILHSQCFPFVLWCLLFICRLLLLFLGTNILIPSFVLTRSNWFIIFQKTLLKIFISLFLSSRRLLFNSYLWKTSVILSFIHLICLIEQVLLSVVVGLSWVVGGGVWIRAWNTIVSTLPFLSVEFRWSYAVFWLFASYVHNFRLATFLMLDISNWVHVILCCRNRSSVFLLWSSNSMTWLVHIVSATATAFRVFRLNTATQGWTSANACFSSSFLWFMMEFCWDVSSIFNSNQVGFLLIWNQSLRPCATLNRSFYLIYLILYRLETDFLISWCPFRVESFHQLSLNRTCLLGDVRGLCSVVLELLCEHFTFSLLVSLVTIFEDASLASCGSHYFILTSLFVNIVASWSKAVVSFQRVEVTSTLDFVMDLSRSVMCQIYLIVHLCVMLSFCTLVDLEWRVF